MRHCVCDCDCRKLKALKGRIRPNRRRFALTGMNVFYELNRHCLRLPVGGHLRRRLRWAQHPRVYVTTRRLNWLCHHRMVLAGGGGAAKAPLCPLREGLLLGAPWWWAGDRDNWKSLKSFRTLTQPSVFFLYKLCNFLNG